MKGLIIIGSAKRGSHTHALAQYLKGQIEEKNQEVNVFDLAERPLHTLDFTGQNPTIDAFNQNAEELKKLADEADFIILGTPNYHGSYSGILKNALDHLTMDQFKMKPVGLVNNSGGIVSAEPLSHLRIIVRSLLGIAVPTQIATHDSDYKQLEDGTYYLSDDEFQLRARLFVDQILSFAENSPYEHLK
ncbi:NAD(P)H-dependent oxidoreductase [Staphylococcus felis]|uniref:FMN-dependent NADPH-azoreductase n=1 Tax=Staphylococcus felis TaxID=46127 RepID=A0A2K3ZAZ0_9STAP|nr:NADPH-dependent FMN reductase [Staphylococcus felis]AVP35771.1 NAD(P)H-dependent oxidoreductase [Staphylococcus felis]MBH9581946.1 NAD(P)H-dependent oxidoreductase [Staphylococcus felis]MDM8326563.1 NADPH-dependent FMN reductase [Staphylococcus felis]MDQ7192864.1 NADPH-dependent FMN reductase [Staphylococcus felis]PNZ35047.1 FMN-dependent NADH-azoreductase [Staphylococcus felis]